MVRLEKHLVDAYASGSRWAQYLQVPGGEKFQISFLIFEFSDLVLKTIRNSLLQKGGSQDIMHNSNDR